MKLIKTETIELSNSEVEHFNSVLSILLNVSDDGSDPDNRNIAKRAMHALDDFLALATFDKSFIKTAEDDKNLYVF